MTRHHRSGQPPAPPARRRAARFVAVGLLAIGLGACGDEERQTDPAAFCDAVADLRANDPFVELTVASPEEMRAAFEELADGASRIAEAAPEDAGVQADRYRDAVEALRDELAGAGYDPTMVDNARYADGVEAYTEAATSLGNAARALCGDRATGPDATADDAG